MQRGAPLFLSLLRDLGLEDRYTVDLLQREWSTLFGEPLSLHTCPADLKKGELLITVDSPLWLQQLKFFKGEMTAKLASYGVTGVRFTHGSLYRARRRGKPSGGTEGSEGTPPPLLLDADDLAWIAETTAAIRDEELKGTLAKAMEKALGRRRPRR